MATLENKLKVGLLYNTPQYWRLGQNAKMVNILYSMLGYSFYNVILRENIGKCNKHIDKGIILFTQNLITFMRCVAIVKANTSIVEERVANIAITIPTINNLILCKLAGIGKLQKILTNIQSIEVKGEVKINSSIADNKNVLQIVECVIKSIIPSDRLMYNTMSKGLLNRAENRILCSQQCNTNPNESIIRLKNKWLNKI